VNSSLDRFEVGKNIKSTKGMNKAISLRKKSTQSVDPKFIPQAPPSEKYHAQVRKQTIEKFGFAPDPLPQYQQQQA
jgi:hypothetical protein